MTRRFCDICEVNPASDIKAEVTQPFGPVSDGVVPAEVVASPLFTLRYTRGGPPDLCSDCMATLLTRLAAAVTSAG